MNERLANPLQTAEEEAAFQKDRADFWQLMTAWLGVIVLFLGMLLSYIGSERDARIQERVRQAFSLQS